jgi:hypothetical protein
MKKTYIADTLVLNSTDNMLFSLSEEPSHSPTTYTTAHEGYNHENEDFDAEDASQISARNHQSAAWNDQEDFDHNRDAYSPVQNSVRAEADARPLKAQEKMRGQIQQSGGERYDGYMRVDAAEDYQRVLGDAWGDNGQNLAAEGSRRGDPTGGSSDSDESYEPVFRWVDVLCVACTRCVWYQTEICTHALCFPVFDF